MPEARAIYAESAFRSLPRLLSLLDRNPFSRTYGCFHRDYWLYKTSDFPDAVRQFGTHALALAYAYDFPGNPYRGNRAVRDWSIAGLNFWAKIQHADGSFDEFYPYERGWVGPTAFTTYAAAESLRLLRTDMTEEAIHTVGSAIRRSARFIAVGESERDDLANHHAMAVLAVATAADVLDDQILSAAVPTLWKSFLYYQDPEGWSREYDGADPGYLSATASFLAKVYTLLANQKRNSGLAAPDGSRAGVSEASGHGSAEGGERASERSEEATLGLPSGRLETRWRASQLHPPAIRPSEIREVLSKTIEFCSYFVYPDGSYGGTIGSRNTVHFYPHGFELLAPEMSMAASIAERMAQTLADGKLVPPEIMSDRYVHYRVPEFLLASLDAAERPAELPPLPFERPPFTRVFPNAGIAAAVHGSAYTVANLAKGGVVKAFDRYRGIILLDDAGWVGKLTDGRVVSSQWIAPEYERHFEDRRWDVRGRLQHIPASRVFTPWKHLLFRLVLLVLGWYPPAAHRLKSMIRKTLILDGRPVPCAFHRELEVTESALSIRDKLTNEGRVQFRHLLLGGAYSLRHVPQSRFFQSDELASAPETISAEDLELLNTGHTLRRERTIMNPDENFHPPSPGATGSPAEEGEAGARRSLGEDGLASAGSAGHSGAAGFAPARPASAGLTGTRLPVELHAG